MCDPIADVTEEQFHRLMTLYGPPPHIKVASKQEVCSTEKPLHTYAYPGRREFPCYSAPSTYVSAMYFYANEHTLPKAAAAAIDKKLCDVASYFSIGGDVIRLRDRIRKDAQVALTELPDDTFGLILTRDGNRERYYPLRNPVEVKAAAAWLTEHRGELRHDVRCKLATNIAKKAAAYDVELDTESAATLDRIRGFGRSSQETISNELRKRAALLRMRRHSSDGAKLDQWADELALRPNYFNDRGHRIKMAALLDNVDREHSLTHEYGSELAMPEDVVCKMTAKEARAALNELVETTTGNLYQKRALAAITPDELSTWMGSDLAGEVLDEGRLDVEKLATILPTLPRPEAARFDLLLQQAGEEPFRKAAQAKASLRTLQELAAEFVPPQPHREAPVKV